MIDSDTKARLKALADFAGHGPIYSYRVHPNEETPHAPGRDLSALLADHDALLAERDEWMSNYGHECDSHVKSCLALTEKLDAAEDERDRLRAENERLTALIPKPAPRFCDRCGHPEPDKTHEMLLCPAKHMCGLMGYNPMMGDRCPGCEWDAEKRKADAR